MKKIFTLITALTLSVGLWAINNVPYIDANGQPQIKADGVTGVINSTDTLKNGWYVVMPTGSEKQTGTLVCQGEVHLIVYDNAKLTATGADNKPGIEVSGEGNSLTIYGSTNQSGQLIAIGGANAAGIGGGNAAAGSNITICGGIVTANGGENASAIGSGKGGDAASNIFVATSFVVKADGNNPPSTVIAATRTATTDIAAGLAGQRYATIEKGTNAQDFAEKITTVAGITSGNKYYIGATTGGNDFYFYVDGSSTTQSIKGAAKEDVADAVALTFTAVTGGWTIQFDNGLYLGLKNANDNGKVQVMEEPVVWTIEEDADKGLLKLHPNDYYLQKNNSGTQFGSYKATQTNVWLESAGSAPVSPILESVYIKGDATKKEYEVGESFDPAGLEVWGVYTKTVKNDTESQITSGITWTIDPETFTEASDNASVKLSASYKDKTSEDKTITGIKVNAVVPKMDKTFDFTKNLYGHKGVSSGSGDNYVSDGDIAVGEKFNEDPAQIEFTVNGSTQTRFWDASSKHELRLYNGATFVLSVVGDYKIIKVEFTGSAVNLTGNGVTVSGKVWEGDAVKSVKFVNTTTGSKINSIKVTYIAAAPAAENPTITPSTVADVYWDPITVTLACATEGADIYYTLDGSEPTALATKYTAPFSVSATTTVKAIAIKSGLDNSEAVSKTFTFGAVFTSLEELVEKQPATEVAARVQVTITDAVIDSLYVTSKGYTNGIYVTAANTVVELYTNDVPDAWKVGGKVSGTIIADWLLYKGTPELQKWEGGWNAFQYTEPMKPMPVEKTGIMVNGRRFALPVRLVKDVPAAD